MARLRVFSFGKANEPGPAGQALLPLHHAGRRRPNASQEPFALHLAGLVASGVVSFQFFDPAASVEEARQVVRAAARASSKGFTTVRSSMTRPACRSSLSNREQPAADAAATISES